MAVHTWTTKHVLSPMDSETSSDWLWEHICGFCELYYSSIFSCITFQRDSWTTSHGCGNWIYQGWSQKRNFHGPVETCYRLWLSPPCAQTVKSAVRTWTGPTKLDSEKYHIFVYARHSKLYQWSLLLFQKNWNPIRTILLCVDDPIIDRCDIATVTSTKRVLSGRLEMVDFGRQNIVEHWKTLQATMCKHLG